MEGDAQTGGGGGGGVQPCLSVSAFHFFPFHPQPPGGTADPTQQAKELKDRTEARASLGNTTKTQRHCFQAGLGQVTFQHPQRLSVHVQKHFTASWIGQPARHSQNAGGNVSSGNLSSGSLSQSQSHLHSTGQLVQFRLQSAC